MPEVLQLLVDRLSTADEHIERLDKMLQAHAKEHEDAKRLQAIEGVGVITASALTSSVDIRQFSNGRDFAAWLGLTPRQHSSGGKEQLGGITKRGDAYIRTLLIHGARTVLQHCAHKTDQRSLWLQSLLLRRHKNVVAVALANKTARVVWAMLTRGETYRLPELIQLEPSEYERVC
jgi:transposase